MPTPWEGRKRWNGKRNPVTLVSTVLARKTAVQPATRFPESIPYATTNPARIPTRLITTCTSVNVDMAPPLSRIPARPATRRLLRRRSPGQVRSSHIAVASTKARDGAGCHLVYQPLRRRGTGVLLLAFPFFLERSFALGNISLITIRIDQRVPSDGLHLLVLGLQAKIGPVCSQKKIAGKTLEHAERLDVILRNLRVVLVAHEHVPGIYIGTADDHGIQGSPLLNLHRPCRAAFGMTGCPMRGPFGASQFDRVSVMQNAIDVSAGTSRCGTFLRGNIRIHHHQLCTCLPLDQTDALIVVAMCVADQQNLGVRIFEPQLLDALVD